jgi:hypothetical protein
MLLGQYVARDGLVKRSPILKKLFYPILIKGSPPGFKKI